MRVLIFILLMGGGAAWLPAQRHSAFVELGGSGGLFSVNHELVMVQGEKFALTRRIGLSFMPIDANNGVNLIVPAALMGRFGQDRHFAELGLGLGSSFTTEGAFFMRGLFIAGYRHHTAGPLFFRLSYTPLMSIFYDFQWEHWVGVSIGVNWGRREE